MDHEWAARKLREFTGTINSIRNLDHLSRQEQGTNEYADAESTTLVQDLIPARCRSYLEASCGVKRFLVGASWASGNSANG